MMWYVTWYVQGYGIHTHSFRKESAAWRWFSNVKAYPRKIEKQNSLGQRRPLQFAEPVK